MRREWSTLSASRSATAIQADTWIYLRDPQGLLRQFWATGRFWAMGRFCLSRSPSAPTADAQNGDWMLKTALCAEMQTRYKHKVTLGNALSCHATACFRL